MIVLIPSYEPDARLVDLVGELRTEAPDATVVVVDDGSGPEYGLVFELARQRGAEVVGHPQNLGKGRALKAGFQHVLEHHPEEVVVCADSDGQHRVADILRVADRARAHRRHPVSVLATGAADPAPPEPHTIVLGGRRFTGDVPARSRFGNAVSRGLFRLATGQSLGDTQTGLRAYPPELLPWLTAVEGDRFEYELTVLLAAPAAGVRLDELEIDTVYLEQNASSHFRPMVDSLRVIRPFLRYIGSSLAAFVLDVIGLQLLFWMTGSLVASVIGARLVSASVNFAVNRQLVFPGRERRPIARDAVRYAALAVVLVGANLALLGLLTSMGIALIAAKLVTELTLYLLGFAVQRRFVFRSPRGPSRSRRPSSSRRTSPASSPSASRPAHPSRL